MDHQDVANKAVASPDSKYEKYIQYALDIGVQPIRSRTGFGAFRHFRSAFHSSISLAIDSGFFSASGGPFMPFHLLDEDLLMKFYMKKGRFLPNFRYFFEQVLPNPSSFNPPCLWALFWAIAKAEHDFLTRYVPYWSHEERLTGHLVSQLITRIEDFEPHWAALDSTNLQTDKAHCRIHYVDTATASREATTGADLGLIVQARLPRQQEYFKAVRFQAKKVNKNGSVTIDLDQTEKLIEVRDLGYYLFYHFYDEKGWSLPPTVLPATQYTYLVDEGRQLKPKHTGAELGKKSMTIEGGNFDFATFITFALTDQASEHGVLSSSAEEAVRLLMATNRGLPNLSRIMAVTLGAQATEVNWDRLLSEYINRGGLQ